MPRDQGFPPLYGIIPTTAKTGGTRECERFQRTEGPLVHFCLTLHLHVSIRIWIMIGASNYLRTMDIGVSLTSTGLYRQIQRDAEVDKNISALFR